MKKVKVFAMALAALAMVSCNNDENGPEVNPSKDVKSLAIVIKNSLVTRAGGVEAGKADENAVKLFGAFVREYKVDNAQAAKYVFRSTAYGTQAGESKKLIFGKVIATSTAYVIANYDPAITVGGKALVATTGSLGEGEPSALNGLYTQAEVDMILQTLVKKDLNTFSKALQADPEDPKFSTGIAEADARYMLMTASQEVPTSPIDGDIASGPGAGNVLLSMALDREFVKIDAGQPELSTTLPTAENNFAKVADDLGVAFDKTTTAYVLRRVVPTVNYFGITELQGVFAKDNGADNDTQGGAATEFRFAFAAPAAGSATNLFYSSRNDSRVAPGATAIIYDVTYTNGETEITKETPGFEDLATAGSDGGEATILANATFHRYYRAYVAEDALNPVKTERIWSAEKNTSYKFTNSITGWGSADEETALTKDETVGLNVNLTIADWTIRELSVPMD